MRISIIVAMSKNRVIGLENQLPWRLPADLARFKRLTMGHHILMGRKTFESIGRPLPGRTNLVLTRKRDYAPEGAIIVRSLQDALESIDTGETEVFVIGGAQVYRQTRKRADRLYITLVEGNFQGDTYFPETDPDDWKLVSEEHRPADEKNPHACTFQIFERTTGM